MVTFGIWPLFIPNEVKTFLKRTHAFYQLISKTDVKLNLSLNSFGSESQGLYLTSVAKDSESPDSSASCLSSRTDRNRTYSSLSKNKDKIRTAKRIGTKNLCKNETRTGHGQRRPPTSSLFPGTEKSYESMKRFQSWEPMESFVWAKLIKLWAGLTKNGPL